MPAPSPNEDRNFWTGRICGPLVSLMQSAGYSKRAQGFFEDFTRDLVVSHLGPRPTKSPRTGQLIPHFDSFCCDDFSPVEYAWNISGMDEATYKMTINLGSEPISQLAGTISDPFNQRESIVVMSRLSSERGVDGRLWDHFRKHLHVEDGATAAHDIMSGMAPNEHTSSNFVAFGFPQDLSIEPLLKVYFSPVPISLRSGQSTDQVIADAMLRVEKELSLDLATSLGKIRDFIQHDTNRRDCEGALRLELLAFDSVQPKKSRFKLYMRTKETSLERLEDIWTLGGRLSLQNGTPTQKGLALQRRTGGHPNEDFAKTVGRHSFIGLSYTEAGPYVTLYYNSMIFSTGDERDAKGRLVGTGAAKQRHLLRADDGTISCFESQA
ncbi:aromatic prenyltransferase (DMATS family) [Venturia effusa]|uniref:Aromatic prenyltransferase (DMATS family) n=1 Tax=Venturia effusa TaxID=50376 RepID=A0A517LAA8_9PEZI|nr:aromatic prenyltransferase (DMATS family) [Venturia effusa]